MTIALHDLELSALPPARTTDRAALASLLPFLSGLAVRLEVRVGTATASVAELTAMNEGSVLPLDRGLEEPVDLLVDVHVVARGVLVAVGDQFGVRLTQTPGR